MKTLAIIQARYSSRRFPGKMLADLCGKPVLQHVVERVEVDSGVDAVVVAFPYGEAAHFDSLDFPKFEAPEEIASSDVLARCVACVEHMMPAAESVIRVCGDNPLLDGQALADLVAAARACGSSYTGYRFMDGKPAITRATGYFAEACWVSALCDADRYLPARHPWREHVTACFYEQDWCSCQWLRVPRWYYGPDTPKFTAIDTPEDLERVRSYVESGCTRSRTEDCERVH